MKKLETLGMIETMKGCLHDTATEDILGLWVSAFVPGVRMSTYSDVCNGAALTGKPLEEHIAQLNTMKAVIKVLPEDWEVADISYLASGNGSSIQVEASVVQLLAWAIEAGYPYRINRCSSVGYLMVFAQTPAGDVYTGEKF